MQASGRWHQEGAGPTVPSWARITGLLRDHTAPRGLLILKKSPKCPFPHPTPTGHTHFLTLKTIPVFGASENHEFLLMASGTHLMSLYKRAWPSSCPAESLRKSHCTPRSWGRGSLNWMPPLLALIGPFLLKIPVTPENNTFPGPRSLLSAAGV